MKKIILVCLLFLLGVNGALFWGNAQDEHRGDSCRNACRTGKKAGPDSHTVILPTAIFEI